MGRSSLFKKLCFSLILFSAICAKSYAAKDVQGERLVERKIATPAEIEEKKKSEWDVGAYYERSNITQGSRIGHWDEITGHIGYGNREIQGYVSASELKRFDQEDYVTDFGAYLARKGYYIHQEIGFGQDVDFIYKFQETTEISHKLAKNLYWQAGYNFRHYKVNDSHMFYPGLIYYFGDSYINAEYGLSHIETRGNAQFGTLKGDFALTKSLHWSIGSAVGQRLYDIFELPARKEYGYILFTGVNYNIYKGVNLRVGCSYGTERPKFIKRSLDVSLSAKF